VVDAESEDLGCGSRVGLVEGFRDAIGEVQVEVEVHDPRFRFWKR
jgi:hypothetical protein